MFSSVGRLGSASEKAADTSIVVTLSAGASVGDLVAVWVALDNVSASQGETTSVSVADSQGNSYSDQEYNKTGGSVNDGVTCVLAWSIITTALSNGDTVTVTCPNVTAKAAFVQAFSGDSITYNSYGASGGTGITPSQAASGSSGKNCLFLAALAYEWKSGQYTEESGWTAFTEEGPTAGGNESCVAISGGYKTTTGAGETHDPTLATSVDYAHVVACFYEDAATPITGSLSETIEPVTLSGAGELGIDGNLSETIAPVTLSAAGELDIGGSLDSTIPEFTLEATGTLSSEITGALNQAIDPVTLSANGELEISGALSEPIGDIELAASGEVDIVGALTSQIDPVQLSASGELDIEGSLSAQIEPVTISGTAELDIIGALSAQIGPVTLEAEGTSQSVITGALDSSIGEVTLAASGELLNTGTLSTQIDEFGLSAAGEVSIAGALEQTIDPFTLSASGELEIAGSVSAALDPVTLSAVGELDISGSLDAAIGDILLTAVGELDAEEVVPLVDVTLRDRKLLFNLQDRRLDVHLQERGLTMTLRDR